MTEGATKLLREIATLLRRHSPEEFEELARMLRRPDFAETVASILSEIALKGRAHRAKPRATGIGALFDELKASDPLKYQLLRDVQARLSNTRLYPSLLDLSKAIEASGFPLPKRMFRKREEVIRAFLQAAGTMPAEEITIASEKILTLRPRSDLKSWSGIIVKNGEPKP